MKNMFKTRNIRTSIYMYILLFYTIINPGLLCLTVYIKSYLDLIEPTSPTSSTLIGCKYDSKSGVKSKRLAPKPPIQSSTINRLEAAGHQLDDLIIVPQLSSGASLNFFFRFSMLFMLF